MGTFYIDKPELSYVHIPRTGMGMKKIIAQWLKLKFNVVDDIPWMIDHPNLSMVRNHIKTGSTLTVVRNPWARIWSLYRKIKTEGYWLDWNHLDLTNLKPFDAWVEDYVNPEIKFEFPRWFNRFTTMSEFIHSETESVRFVLKAENLEKDFKQVQEYLNCYDPLPDLSEYDHNEHWKYFSDKSKKIVAKTFERDLDEFRYTYY